MLLHSRGERGIGIHALHVAFATSQKHISLESCQITAMKMMLLFQVWQLLSVLSAVNWRNWRNFQCKGKVLAFSFHVIHTAHFVQRSWLMNFSHLVFLFSSTSSSLWTLFACWPWKSERQTQADTTPGNNTGWCKYSAIYKLDREEQPE